MAVLYVVTAPCDQPTTPFTGENVYTQDRIKRSVSWRVIFTLVWIATVDLPDKPGRNVNMSGILLAVDSYKPNCD